MATAEQARLVFLGTGAIGGTLGTGRSRRLESSLLVEAAETVLFDVTRDLTQIGRSAPRHEELSRAVRLLCGRARPAYDGLVERLRR